MTTDERKRGLRAAVDAKLARIMKDKDSSLTVLHANELERAVMAFRFGVDLLWQIIDSLVDECAEQDIRPGAPHDATCPKCGGDWPWCEACQSYHSPCNPTCKAKLRPAESPKEG